jgi:hypothetical protein
MRKGSFAILFVGLACVQGNAFAQMNMPPIGTYPLTFFLPPQGLPDDEDERAGVRQRPQRPNVPLRKSQPQVRGSTSLQGASAGTSAQNLSFAISQQRRQANIATFISSVSNGNPQVRNELGRIFLQRDIFGIAEQQMRQTYGLSLNNVADNAALWLSASWAASNNYDGEITRPQLEALKRQFSANYARSARLVALDDAGKQDMADFFLLKAMWIDTNMNAHKTDPQKREIYRRLVATTSLRDMGIDFTTMNLTDRGLVPK